MLGLLLLYFIGKKFYELAGNYNKNEWGYAILGVATYYVGAFIFGILLGVLMLILESDWLDTANKFQLALVELPVGILSCYILYVFLEKMWKKEKPPQDNMIDQIGNS
ncbi:hypothetical protein ACQY1Q_04090 [Tenacibaculum sp. TC6]|uniref:hypothetical protein n=1 Tax=Tenacibaculum sp. TC6 TaxID=3423223 RepID=UPI003D36AF1C